jgi:hypothetical protein
MKKLKVLSHPDLKLKGISIDSQVSSAFYTTKQTPPPIQVDDEGRSFSPFASDFITPPTPHQCVVIDATTKNLFSQINKTKPVNLTRNWYSKPTPPNLQF